jgi:hypothetical protein
MLDEDGNLWLTARVRPAPNPAFCKAGSDNPSAKLYPLETSGRQAEMYDPKTGKFMLANLCFSTHHLQFASDANDTLFFSAGGGNSNVLGWLNARLFEQTGDANKAQGWTALVLDTNGNGKRDAYVEPGQPADPAKDTRILGDTYGIAVSPVDGSVWGSVLGYPGKLIRVSLGSNPPATALTEVYDVPLDDPRAPVHGFSPRGMDIDRNGVVWAPLASGHLASFDRRKCKGPLSGPAATGKQCPEGWTLYPLPGPQFEGLAESGSAEASYYTWVDQFDNARAGQERPDRDGQRGRFVRRARQRQVRRDARTVSARLLRQERRRADRRPEQRLERTRHVDDVRFADALPHGDRQGDAPQGLAHPDPSQPARGLTGTGPSP